MLKWTFGIFAQDSFMLSFEPRYISSFLRVSLARFSIYLHVKYAQLEQFRHHVESQNGSDALKWKFSTEVNL